MLIENTNITEFLEETNRMVTYKTCRFSSLRSMKDSGDWLVRNFYNCVFDGCIFDNCSLIKYNFRFCTFIGCTFRGCVVKLSDFSGSKLSDVSFKTCNIDKDLLVGCLEKEHIYYDDYTEKQMKRIGFKVGEGNRASDGFQEEEDTWPGYYTGSQMTYTEKVNTGSKRKATNIEVDPLELPEVDHYRSPQVKSPRHAEDSIKHARKVIEKYGSLVKKKLEDEDDGATYYYMCSTSYTTDRIHSMDYKHLWGFKNCAVLETNSIEELKSIKDD